MLLRKFCGIEKTDNGYLIHGDAGDIKLVFMTDDIIRIRVSFDRKFKEASYALVTTAWEDELDELFQEERTRIQAKDVVCEEKEDALIFHTTALKLVMKKQPIQFLLYQHSSSSQMSFHAVPISHSRTHFQSAAGCVFPQLPYFS